MINNNNIKILLFDFLKEYFLCIKDHLNNIKLFSKIILLFYW